MTLLGLHLVGHCHTEIGVVDEAVCEHKVDGDNRGQYVDLADKNKSHGEKAGQTDSCHRSLVWPFPFSQKGHCRDDPFLGNALKDSGCSIQAAHARSQG